MFRDVRFGHFPFRFTPRELMVRPSPRTGGPRGLADAAIKVLTAAFIACRCDLPCGVGPLDRHSAKFIMLAAEIAGEAACQM